MPDLHANALTGRRRRLGGRGLSLTAALLRVCDTRQREREDDDAQARSSTGDRRRHAA
jgi:hypothetical protein